MTVYFDNAATTAVCAEAAEAAMNMMTERYGNVSSTHPRGKEAKAVLDIAREKIAGSLGCGVNELFFTSGGTESDNWAIFSAAHRMRHKGKHIITSSAEHAAVLMPMKSLVQNGYDVTFLPPDKTGAVSVEAVETALREDTILVSLMLVSNETGAINPIREISDMLKRRGSQAILHTDAVQGFMKIPFSAKTLGADLISISGHKLHAPKGIGALYIRSGVRLPARQIGGEQESSLRAGTENTAGIAAFAAAIEAEKSANSDEILHTLRQYALSALSERIPDLVIVSPENGAPHILNISLPGYLSTHLMNLLDIDGICVSKSSACKKGARSHVLTAMNLPNAVIDGAIRVSFSRFNTTAEIDFFAEKLLNATQNVINTKK